MIGCKVSKCLPFTQGHQEYIIHCYIRTVILTYQNLQQVHNFQQTISLCIISSAKWIFRPLLNISNYIHLDFVNTWQFSNLSMCKPTCICTGCFTKVNFFPYSFLNNAMAFYRYSNGSSPEHLLIPKHTIQLFQMSYLQKWPSNKQIWHKSKTMWSRW